MMISELTQIQIHLSTHYQIHTNWMIISLKTRVKSNRKVEKTILRRKPLYFSNWGKFIKTLKAKFHY